MQIMPMHTNNTACAVRKHTPLYNWLSEVWGRPNLGQVGMAVNGGRGRGAGLFIVSCQQLCGHTLSTHTVELQIFVVEKFHDFRDFGKIYT